MVTREKIPGSPCVQLFAFRSSLGLRLYYVGMVMCVVSGVVSGVVSAHVDVVMT